MCFGKIVKESISTENPTFREYRFDLNKCILLKTNSFTLVLDVQPLVWSDVPEGKSSNKEQRQKKSCTQSPRDGKYGYCGPRRGTSSVSVWCLGRVPISDDGQLH